MLYKLTFATVGHGHQPTKQIAAPDIEQAIKKAREMVGAEWQEVPCVWAETITYIDGIARL